MSKFGDCWPQAERLPVLAAKGDRCCTVRDAAPLRKARSGGGFYRYVHQQVWAGEGMNQVWESEPSLRRVSRAGDNQ